jgi:hypothetical protein
MVGPSELASDWLASQTRTLLYMLRPTFGLAAELGFAPRPSGFRDRWTTVIPLSKRGPSPEIASGSSLYECEVLLIERRRQKDWYASRLRSGVICLEDRDPAIE